MVLLGNKGGKSFSVVQPHKSWAKGFVLASGQEEQVREN